ncbi:hypothetical protein E4U49_004823 [Claviceps purpurea]|nr:hypothetical protein E4U49_004823 [Claviceps purpurea]
MAKKACSIDVHDVIGPTIILLALRAKPDTPTTRLTILATLTVIASFIWLLYVSYLEHVRSVRPSTILCLYLGISSLLDLASSRTSFFIPGYDVVAPIHLSSYFVKLVILTTEVVEKRKLLMWHLLAGVLPRLAYIGFTFAEPFLVKRVLDFTAEPEGPNTRNFGYGLIGAYALVHIGKAVRCRSLNATLLLGD